MSEYNGQGDTQGNENNESEDNVLAFSRFLSFVSFSHFSLSANNLFMCLEMSIFYNIKLESLVTNHLANFVEIIVDLDDFLFKIIEFILPFLIELCFKIQLIPLLFVKCLLLLSLLLRLLLLLISSSGFISSTLINSSEITFDGTGVIHH